MLHELLMTLLGNAGGLFQYTIDNNVRKIKLVENLEFIHPAEVEICNKLAQLGTNYASINEFVENYSFGKFCTNLNSNLKQGLYITALCDALEQIIITPYRKLIGELEKELLQDHFLNVTHLQSHLENYFLLFSKICSLINEIETKKAHGCQIVDLVYRCTLTGNSIIKDAMNKILSICHQAMYKQLREWLINGILCDKYSEFFVCVNKSDGNNNNNNNTELEKPVRNQDDELGIGGFTVSQLNEVEDMLMGGRFNSTYSLHTLTSSMFPSYLNLKTANKILFTGEALQLFKPKNINDIQSKISQSNDEQLQKKFQSLNFNDSSNKSLRTEFSIMNEQLDEFSREIHYLAMENEFSIVKFEAFIDKIRNFVSQSTWSIIVEKYDLPGELQKLKDMYLLGRGELFATFIDSAKTLLNKMVDSNFEYNINYLFQQSISRMLLDNEPWLSKYRIIVQGDASNKQSSEDGWSRIGLSYQVEWPFYSLITQNVLNKYNEIFSYLLSIRRVQNELHQTIILQKSIKLLKLQDFDSKIWLARNHMTFLIDNLQFYLQADVFETQYDEMMENIRMSKDFEQIRYAHDTFLTKIQSQCFMLHKPIFNCLNEILEICLLFCTILNTNGGVQNVSKDQIINIIKEFQNRTNILYSTFKTLQKRQLGTHLEQLLTRINFNNYFAQNNGLLIKI